MHGGSKAGSRSSPTAPHPRRFFSCRRWFLLPPERGARPVRPAAASTASPAEDWTQPLVLKVREVKAHADTLVANSEDIADRNAAEGLKGARICVPRSSFPTPAEGEYYWVDLIGLQVVNREGVVLGEVRDLLSTGPQTVLVIQAQQDGKTLERMIPFVSNFVDKVDMAARCITVDWQPDY